MNSIKRRVDQLESKFPEHAGFISGEEESEIAKAIMDDLEHGGEGTEQRRRLKEFPQDKVQAISNEAIEQATGRHFPKG